MNHSLLENPFAHDASVVISRRQMPSLYDDDDEVHQTVAQSASINDKVIQERAIKMQIRNDERHHLLVRSLKDLCSRPAEGEQWRIVTEKSFNAYAFILSLLEDGIADLHLAIYRINEPTVRSLLNMLDDGRIARASFIISSFFNQTKKPEKWAQMLATYCAANPQKTQFAYLHNHAKICCVRTVSGECYIFEGSGNMSDNARIEQYTYEQSRMTYEFHVSWMDELISKTRL